MILQKNCFLEFFSNKNNYPDLLTIQHYLEFWIVIQIVSPLYGIEEFKNGKPKT